MGGGWSTPRSGRFTPGKDPVPFGQEAGWAPGSVWTGAENIARTGIRSPGCTARSKSLQGNCILNLGLINEDIDLVALRVSGFSTMSFPDFAMLHSKYVVR